MSTPPDTPPGSQRRLSGISPWNEWALATFLFCSTVVCVSVAGLFYGTGDFRFFASLWAIFLRPRIIIYGLLFSIPLISILLAHELGHFFACRYYGMNCTPPYFIPLPISIAGTMGAFIRIRSPFPNKRALFDIGVAGPLAGFVFVVPFLYFGISLSQVVPKGSFPPGAPSFGEPLIFRLLGAFILGYSPDRQDMLAHPIAMAAWVGLLATSLNLLPIWQLDGGHIAYAVLGRERQRQFSLAGLAFLILLSIWQWRSPSYLLFAVLLLVFGWRARFYHPSTLFDSEPIGRGRVIVGVLALLILLFCFIPNPISFGY